MKPFFLKSLHVWYVNSEKWATKLKVYLPFVTISIRVHNVHPYVVMCVCFEAEKLDSKIWKHPSAKWEKVHKLKPYMIRLSLFRKSRTHQNRQILFDTVVKPFGSIVIFWLWDCHYSAIFSRKITCRHFAWHLRKKFEKELCSFDSVNLDIIYCSKFIFLLVSTQNSQLLFSFLQIFQIMMSAFPVSQPILISQPRVDHLQF